jgi:hypothetical protein
MPHLERQKAPSMCRFLHDFTAIAELTAEFFSACSAWSARCDATCGGAPVRHSRAPGRTAARTLCLGQLVVRASCGCGFSLARANPIYLLHTTLQVCILDGAIEINRISVYIFERAQLLRASIDGGESFRGSFIA